jgi:excinuclease ABC C subunit domain protein (fragment)
MEKQYYVYLLECCDKTLYCGYTTDIAKRVAKHNQGKGAKYTKGRLPVRLVYKESYNSKTEALKREYNIKQLSRERKLALIEKENKDE